MLKRIEYYTMNSWNLNKAPAYNMKIYNLGFARETESKLYELMDYEGAYEGVNFLVRDFNARMRDWGYSAGFNGRSGGYLVLYKNGTCAGFKAKDVPSEVLKEFRRLALDIRAEAKNVAEHGQIQEVNIVKTEKVFTMAE